MMEKAHSDRGCARVEHHERNRLRKGSSVVVAGQATKLSIQSLGLIVLSRILEPRDFGIVAMVAVAVAIGDILRDFGISIATLRAPNLNDQQASNAFWINAALGAACAVAMVLSAPLLASLYNESRLLTVAVVLAIPLLLNGIQSQIQVQLARRQKYVVIAITEVSGQLVGLSAAIVFALQGAGYWALVVQACLTATVVLIVRSVALGWVPARPRRGHGSMTFIRTGGHLGLSQLLAFASNNADSVAIGSVLGPTALGYYNRAFQLYSLPRTGILDPLTQVLLPAASRRRGASSDSRLDLRNEQLALGVVTIALYAAGAAASDSAIPLILGPNWEPAAPVFRALCIAGFFAAFSMVAYWQFILAEATRAFLHLQLFTKPLTIAAVVISAEHGIVAVAYTYAVAQAVSWPINLAWLRFSTTMRVRRYVYDGLFLLVAASASAVVGGAAVKLWEWSNLFLATAISGGTTLALFLALCLAYSPIRVMVHR